MDAYETRKKSWEELDVTRDELNNFSECLKKEEFRKLLIEYAEEVSNPENRKLYEKEITQLEKERGVDVTFVNPEPGYVIKTSINGEKKCFLNISKNENVGKPTSQPSYADGNRGLRWSIPYSLAPPRDDFDKQVVRCTVFDVVFHPDTLYLASKNPRFADLVNNTAIDGVENSFQVKLDRKNLKFPKMTFKGIGQPTVIRKACEKPVESSMDLEPEIYQKLMASYDECRKSKTTKTEEKTMRAPPVVAYNKIKKPSREDAHSAYSVPKFTVKHQSDVDMQDFRDCPEAKLSAAIPNRLVIVIDLPLLKCASDATLDVQERSIFLISEKPAKYKLELPLPYCVDGDAGNAKFDSKYKKLTVTLPVVRKNVTVHEMRDSGVESDQGSPLTRSGDEIIADRSNEGSLDGDSSLHSENLDSKSFRNLISEIDGVKGYHEDTALRTNSAENSELSLMNPNVKYTLPPYVCNVYDVNFAITVNVKNVDSESISYKTLENDAGIHVVFSSIGAGFFPIYYSLCLKIGNQAIVSGSTVVVDPWDNNVVFTLQLTDASSLTQYFVGLDEQFMEVKDLQSKVSLTDKFNQLMVEPQTDEDQQIEVVAEGDDVVINIQASNLDSDDEADRKPKKTSRKKERKHGLSKSRSISESSGDELPSSTGSNICKGILKSRRSEFSRSVSESSIDDTAGPVSSIDFHYDSIQDFNSESDCSSLKKSVRFNDVVSRQLYRSNSSILGQRKKNQRKLRNKKRAHERRMSESENSETEDREKYRINSKDDDSEDRSHDTVKPILNRDKLSEKTDNIEIDKPVNNTSKVYKTKRDKVTNEDATLRENDEMSVDATAGTEFKSDLIFDLDM